MNEQTAEALKAIAAQIGTTSEHLWAALVAQAPIDGVATLLQVLILAAVTYAHVGLTRKAWAGFDRNPGPTITAGIAWLPLTIIWMSAFFYIPMLIAAFLNPEYWALKEILDAIKGAH